VELLGVLLLESDPSAIDLRWLGGRGLPICGRRLDVPLAQLDDPLVVDVTRRRDDDVRAGVVSLVVGVDVGGSGSS
jgi:hypothetical protein